MLLSFTSATVADSDVRLSRRIQRDTVERGRNIQNVLDQVSEHLSNKSIQKKHE